MISDIIRTGVTYTYRLKRWQIRILVIFPTLILATAIYLFLPYLATKTLSSTLDIGSIIAIVSIGALSLGVAEIIVFSAERDKRLKDAAEALTRWDLAQPNATILFLRNHTRPLTNEEQSEFFPESSDTFYVSKDNPTDLASRAILQSDLPRLAQTIPHLVTGIGLVISFTMIAFLMINMGAVIKEGDSAKTKTPTAAEQTTSRTTTPSPQLGGTGQISQIGEAVSNVAGKFLISGSAVLFSTLCLLLIKLQYAWTSTAQSTIVNEVGRRVRSNEEYSRRKRDSHESAMINLTKNLINETSKLESIKVSITDIGEHVLENVAMKLSATFDQELRKLMADQKSNFEALGTVLEKNFEQIAQNLTTANTKARSEMMDVKGLTEVADKLGGLVSQIKESARTATEEGQTQLTEGINGTFKLIQDELNLNSQSQREMLGQLQTTVHELSQTTQKTVTDSQQKFASASENVASNISNLNNTITKFDTVARNIDSIVATTSKSWQEGSRVAQTFKDTADRLQNISAGLDTTTRGITDFAAKTKQITLDQSNLATKQANSLNAITEAFPELKKATIEIASRFGDLGKGFSENMEQVLVKFENISGALATPPTSAADRIEESTDALCDAIDKLMKSFKERT